MSETLAVIDFETNGMPASCGGRPTEIAAVLVREGAIIGRYQNLMNAGVFIPAEIQALTGISNAMVRRAPPADQVMAEVADFVGDYPLVAHNASFDRSFWDEELLRLGKKRIQEFACTMLLARRVFPTSPNHKLGTLVRRFGLPVTGQFHRALADAEATSHLLMHLNDELARRFDLGIISHELLTKIQRTPRTKLDQFIARHCVDQPSAG